MTSVYKIGRRRGGHSLPTPGPEPHNTVKGIYSGSAKKVKQLVLFKLQTFWV